MRPSHRAFQTVLVLLVTGLLTAASPAADGPAVVVAVGRATLKTRPDLLRVRIMLTADGSGAREAVQVLAKRRDEVKQKLLAAGAKAESIEMEEPTVGTGTLSPQQRQMHMCVAMQRNRGGMAPPASTQPQRVTVSCKLQAEWPLSAGAGDGLLVVAEELQNKIKEAAKAPKRQLTPEEQEIAEETAAAANAGDTGGDAALKPDEPSFTFVHRVSEEERAKLAADAVTRAKTDAARLAAAAGRSVGPIRRMSSGLVAGEEQTSAMAEVYYRMATGTAAATDDRAAEASGAQAGQVSYVLSVSVTFELR